ncbi:MAG: glycine oxidase ThiO [Hyphococcus sp.]
MVEMNARRAHGPAAKGVVGNMANGFDIAVIGGGVIGLSLARALCKRGARVAVFDAGAEIPAATNAAAGMLAPSFESGAPGDEALDEALYAFAAASLAQWPAFAAELEDASGVDIDYRADGILGVAFTEAEMQRAQTVCHDLQARRADVAMLTGDEARRLEPSLAPEIIGALHAKQDAQVDPRKALAALRIAFDRDGGALVDQRVETVTEARSGFSLVTDDGARISADRLVVASGAAAMQLIDGLPAAPVFPVKGDAVALSAPAGALRKVVRAPGAYLCPKAGDRLVIGASETPDRSDLEADAAEVAALKRHGARALPAIAGAPELERWAGLRPATPDGAPILGGDPDGPERVFLALGHYRNGVLLAPASAEALAGEIMDNASGGGAFDPAPFRPDRFRETRTARRCG